MNWPCTGWNVQEDLAFTRTRFVQTPSLDFIPTRFGTIRRRRLTREAGAQHSRVRRGDGIERRGKFELASRVGVG